MSKYFWLMSAGAMALSTPAFAQQTTDQQTEPSPTQEAAAVTDPDEIIVTATRRNEALSDVPIAVSAVSGETLENSGATDIRQLQQLSPSLQVSSTQSEGGASTARIRGVGTVGDNPGLESSVAVFIDGVYRSRNSTALTELGQIDRVEVLRGPQGTLFGRNASAGIISVITAKPRFEQQVSGQLSYGNYDFLRGELGVTGPLSDTVAYRVDGIYQERDGLLKDVISGRRVNDRDRYLVRGQMLFEPNDALSLRLIGDYTNRDEECCAAVYLTPFDTVNQGGTLSQQPSTIVPLLEGLGAVIPQNPKDRLASITPGRTYRQDVKDWGLSGELVYDFGGAELTSITAYRDNDFIRGGDFDYNNLDIVARADDGGSSTRFRTFSQELRLQGEAGRIDWLVGGYYANENARVRDNIGYGADYERYANCLLFTGLAAQGLPNFVQPTQTGNCVNSTLLSGAQTQINSGIQQLTAGIAQVTAGITQVQAGIVQVQAGVTALSAIPPADRTPAQSAQLAALQAQLAALQAQLAQLQATRVGLQTQLAPLEVAAPTVNLVNANPARPGFGSVAAGLGMPTGTLNNQYTNDLFDQTSRNFALFTHNVFRLTDQFSVTAGLRYTNERKTLDADLQGGPPLCGLIAGSPASALAQLPCVLPSLPGGRFTQENAQLKDDALSGTLVLSYKPIDTLLTYASYSRGYKAGGFNLDRTAMNRQIFAGSTGPIAGPICGPTDSATRCVNGAASLEDLIFDSEQVDAFELGGKYNGRGFDLNVAAFHQIFDNFQLNTFNGVNFIVENINSCKDDLDGADTDNDPATGACTGGVKGGVKSQGVEVEAFMRPMDDIGVNLGATYVDTKYGKNLVGSDGRPLTNALFQLPGERLSNSSLWTLSGSFTYTPPLGTQGLRGLIYFDGRYQSKFNTGSDLDLEKVQDSYFTSNARVGVRDPDAGWGLEFWAQNLFNTYYKQIAFDAFIQGSCTTRGAENNFCTKPNTGRANQLFGAFLADPRTYGLTLRFNF